ncbi:MAG: hypothetical protein K9H61_13495 [Bacteroidia bacterium]|nr:hypothetical protein [Bacteroidia bacterium]MCF8425189.1 hypothetical protein [Bacteroidia bacterium]MCF8447998.1 hypothetical protein [Bacteroidia bacterium]
MEIQRKDLIQLCNKFLIDEIDKNEIAKFASTLIFSDQLECNDEDEVMTNTIVEWDNEEANFPINKVNIQLWKERLENNIDKLIEYNFWNSHIEKQKEICSKFNSKWNPINKKLNVWVSLNLNQNPLNGIRLKTEDGTSGWYIWAGDYSKNKDFFQAILAEHLLQIRPEIINYFGLDTGFRFLLGKDNYEEVWLDETLKK